MVESIHEAIPIVENSNLSSGQVWEIGGNRRTSENIHMGVDKVCHRTKMTDDRIFNMDKTGFSQKNNIRKVIVDTGLKFFW